MKIDNSMGMEAIDSLVERLVHLLDNRGWHP